jgi:hypothetical protein
MSLPESLKFGLKEWDIVCRALGSGRQIMLLRKGGISESIGGFELEHSQFLLFPTFLHQNLQMLKSEVHAHYQPHSAEPAKIQIELAAEVTDIVQLKNRQQMDALDAEHIWTSPLIDMRFNYRPANPLYLLLLRTYRLPQAITIDNTPAYAGCKSWVPLEQAIDTAGATAVLEQSDYQRQRDRITSIVSGSR